MNWTIYIKTADFRRKSAILPMKGLADSAEALNLPN